MKLQASSPRGEGGRSFAIGKAYLGPLKPGCPSLGGEPSFHPGPFFENDARWREYHLHPHDYRHVDLYAILRGLLRSSNGLGAALFRHDRPRRNDQSTCRAGSVLAPAFLASEVEGWRVVRKLSFAPCPSLNFMGLHPSTSKVGGSSRSMWCRRSPASTRRKRKPRHRMAGLVRKSSVNSQPFAIPSLQQSSEERDCNDQSAHAPNGNGSVDGRLGYAS